MSQSQSQQSNFILSLYNGEVEQLTYLVLSNPFKTPSDSQAIYNMFNPDFLQLNIPTLVPPSLTRVGPDRRKIFILYNNMVHTK